MTNRKSSEEFMNSLVMHKCTNRGAGMRARTSTRACMHARTHGPTWQQNRQQRPWSELKLSLISGQPVSKAPVPEHGRVDAYACNHTSMTRMYACMHAHTHAEAAASARAKQAVMDELIARSSFHPSVASILTGLPARIPRGE